MGVIRVVFWLWFFASIGILVLRTSNKRSGAVGVPVEGRLGFWDTLLGKKLPDDASRPSTPPDAQRVPLPPTGPPQPTPGSAALTTATSDSPAPGPSSAGTRQGLFASTSHEPLADPSATADQVLTVADALRGIEWPCGLTPVVDLAAQHLLDHRVAFSTDEASPAEVGRRLGDALEAQGYALRSTSDAVAEAWRRDASLEVRIHPDAAKVQHNGAPAYPSLPPGSVVAVFTLRPR